MWAWFLRTTRGGWGSKSAVFSFFFLLLRHLDCHPIPQRHNLTQARWDKTNHKLCVKATCRCASILETNARGCDRMVAVALAARSCAQFQWSNFYGNDINKSDVQYGMTGTIAPCRCRWLLGGVSFVGFSGDVRVKPGETPCVSHSLTCTLINRFMQEGRASCSSVKGRHYPSDAEEEGEEGCCETCCGTMFTLLSICTCAWWTVAGGGGATCEHVCIALSCCVFWSSAAPEMIHSRIPRI